MTKHIRLLTTTALAIGIALPAVAMDITIAQTSAVNTLDLDLSVLSHIYPKLILRNPDYSLAPSLATGWEAVDDTTWKFTLVEGATFANDEPLDAKPSPGTSPA